MSMTTGDKVGLSILTGVVALIGVELWKSRQPASGAIVTDRSPNTNQVYTSVNYRFDVNQAQGLSVTLPDGEHEFIFGQYPKLPNGQLSTQFVPSKTQTPYIWGHGTVKQGS